MEENVIGREVVDKSQKLMVTFEAIVDKCCKVQYMKTTMTAEGGERKGGKRGDGWNFKFENLGIVK